MNTDDIPELTPPLIPADLLPDAYEMKKQALKKRQKLHPSLMVNVSSRSYFCHLSNPANKASHQRIIGFRQK